MACYYPLIGYRPLVAGERVHFKKGPHSGQMVNLPCGACLGCRIDKSQQWAVRITHESQLHQENCFVTLTYDDDHLPEDESLHKSHFQKFLRALRQKIAPKKIRFFHVGEYGDEGRRPHYHAALFGIDFHEDRYPWRLNDQGDQFYRSPLLESVWTNGNSDLTDLNYTTAGYIGRYAVKKITGEKADEHYTKITRFGELSRVAPEYATMSRRPGIGADWLKKYYSDVFPRDFVVLSNGGTTKVPDYYLRKMAEKFPQEHLRVKAKRKKEFSKKKTDNTFRRLEAKEKVKTAQVAFLKRKL